jgi:hypothetical protein
MMESDTDIYAIQLISSPVTYMELVHIDINAMTFTYTQLYSFYGTTYSMWIVKSVLVSSTEYYIGGKVHIVYDGTSETVFGGYAGLLFKNDASTTCITIVYATPFTWSLSTYGFSWSVHSYTFTLQSVTYSSVSPTASGAVTVALQTTAGPCDVTVDTSAVTLIYYIIPDDLPVTITLDSFAYTPTAAYSFTYTSSNVNACMTVDDVTLDLVIGASCTLTSYTFDLEG